MTKDLLADVKKLKGWLADCITVVLQQQVPGGSDIYSFGNSDITTMETRR